VPENVLGQVLMPRPGSMPWKLSVPVAPVSARVKVLLPICCDPDPHIPEKRSKAVKPLGGTSTIAALFRFVTLRLFNVSEIAVTVPGRLATEIEEPTDALRVLLTVIPPDEVHVVTFPEVVHEA